LTVDLCWPRLADTTTQPQENAMIRVPQGAGLLVRGYEEPLRVHPPREGMRPGTAAGDPQTPF